MSLIYNNIVHIKLRFCCGKFTVIVSFCEVKNLHDKYVELIFVV